MYEINDAFVYIEFDLLYKKNETDLRTCCT